MPTRNDGPELSSSAEKAWRVVLLVMMSGSFALDYSATRTLYPMNQYVAGQSDVPFRIFPILVLRAGEHIALLGRIAAHTPFQPRTTDSFVLFLMAFCGMMAAAWCTGKITESLGVSRRLSEWVRLLVIVMSFFNLTPAWGLNYTIPYDVPALAFFACGVWLLVSGRMAWFYPLFCIATLNRETTCFLVVFFIVWTVLQYPGRADLRRYVGIHVIALTALWFAVKLIPTRLFHGHAFSTAEHEKLLHRVIYNLLRLAEPQQWPVLLSACAFTLPVIWLGRRWIRHKPYEWAVGITLACRLAGSIFEGIVVELRIFAEWAALLTPCLGLIIAHRLRSVNTPSGMKASH